ncbi:MAG TPA: hypothetical protein VFF73_26730 [Planctomycetota bacterium]|nr:hypothetical protein [Planctomycetota bacterium]
MAKGQTAEQKQRLLEILKKARGAAVSLSDLALYSGIPAHQVLTLLGQLGDQVECASRATMESHASMKWEDVDSTWRIKGVAAKAPVKWPPRPGTVPFGSETAADLETRMKRGKLAHDNVVLAAWLGHAGAREVLGAKAPAEVADLGEWFAGFRRWKTPVLVRALAAATRRALAAFDAARPGDERPQRAVTAAFAYAKEGGKAGRPTGTALGAEEAAKEAPEGPARAAATAAARLGILIAAIEAGKPTEALVAEVAGAVMQALPDADARAAVREELGAWALS